MIYPTDKELSEHVLGWVSNNAGKTFEDALFGAMCAIDLIQQLNPDPEIKLNKYDGGYIQNPCTGTIYKKPGDK